MTQNIYRGLGELSVDRAVNPVELTALHIRAVCCSCLNRYTSKMPQCFHTILIDIMVPTTILISQNQGVLMKTDQYEMKGDCWQRADSVDM